MWVVKYGPSKVHSHIQALDVKHIYYVTTRRQNNYSALVFHYYSRCILELSEFRYAKLISLFLEYYKENETLKEKAS